MIATGLDRSNDAYRDAGIAAYQLSHYKRAARFLQQAVALDPADAEAIEYLGLTFRAVGKEAMAASLLNKAAQVRRGFTPERRTFDRINVRLL